jgi:uncharacterized protein YdeI (YjbR/CyaY-like superfamily)
MIKIHYFETPAEFRQWLEQNHKTVNELLVGFYKVGTKRKSMTWSESVDQALCFGWIDGVRKSIDEASYCIRFSPRNASSIWSAVNINKVKQLLQQNMMQAAGIEIYHKRIESKSKIYAFENEEKKFSAAYEKDFKANKKAWKFFNALAPSYRKLSSHWVMSAKQESTQLKRLQALIADSELGTNKWKDNKYIKK